jgi:hypothetical protein
MNCDAIDWETPAFLLFGFHDYVETEAMFMRHFDELRRREIIP